MEPFEFLDQYLAEFRRHLVRETLLETFGLLALGSFVVFFIGVIVAAIVPIVPVLRWAFAALCIGLAVGLLARLGVRVRRFVADPLFLAALLERRVPALGTGLATVCVLRPALVEPCGSPRFSAALLHAEAMRLVHILGDHAPEDLVRNRRALALVVLLAGLVVLLAATSVLLPRSIARAVRELAGLSERFTPSWMMEPPRMVESLAYDLRTALVFEDGQGGMERVFGDETGDVTLPSGMIVEVSGHLSTRLASGSIVLTEGASESRSPLDLRADGQFAATFQPTGPGTWHIVGIDASGARMIESARRRVQVVGDDAPRVTVEPPERLGLKPREAVVVRFRIESPTGMSGVDAVHTFSLDPDRAQVRTRVRELPPGTRHYSGEVLFSLPDDIAESDGRVDLIIEAFGRLTAARASTGRGEPVRFFLDLPRHRHAAAAEAWVEASTDAVTLLADLHEQPDDHGRADGSSIGQRAVQLSGRLRRLAEAAREDPECPARDARALSDASEALSSVAMSASEADAARAVLLLGELVRREQGRTLAGRVRDLGREAARLRSAADRARAGSVSDIGPEVHASLLRARRTLRLLEGDRRRIEMQAEFAGVDERLKVVRLATGTMRAMDGVQQADEQVGDDPSVDLLLERTARSLEEMVAAWTEIGSLGATPLQRTVLLGKETLPALRQALAVQREVMNRTAQAAFELKGRVEALSVAKAPDPTRLLEMLDDATDRVGRVPADGLSDADADELARLREDFSVLRDLLNASDFETAFRVSRDVGERMTQLVLQLRDDADFADDESPAVSTAKRGQANRLARLVPPLRDVQRVVGSFLKERSGLVGPAEKEELRAIKRDQDKALALVVRLQEAVRKAAGGPGPDDVQGVTGSARRNMEESSRRLAEMNPAAAEAHQRQTVQDLSRLRRLLEQGSDDPASRTPAPADDEPVRIPPAVRAQAPDELRRLLEVHAREPAAAASEELVRSYWEALLKPL